MSATFKSIHQAIQDDPENQSFTQQGIEPLYSVHKEATLLIVGQAPGIKAEESHLFWNDASGNRLREWIDIDRDTFYHSNKIAILPMDFYYPGKGKFGDLPPRKDFAEKWHPQLLELMPNIQLTLLVGSYSVHRYLNLANSVNLTDIVQNYQNYLPKYFPLIHPSPRNQIWLKKHPWFEKEVVPNLKKQVNKLMN